MKNAPPAMSPILLVRDLGPFKAGETVDIADLDELDARAIFGDGVYELWRAWRDAGSPSPGKATIISIDRGGRT